MVKWNPSRILERDICIRIYISNMWYLLPSSKKRHSSSRYPKNHKLLKQDICLWRFFSLAPMGNRWLSRLTFLWISRVFFKGIVMWIKQMTFCPVLSPVVGEIPSDVCTAALSAAPQSQNNYFSFTLSSADLRSTIKDYGGELLLDEAEDNLAAEKKKAHE